MLRAQARLLASVIVCHGQFTDAASTSSVSLGVLEALKLCLTDISCTTTS